MNNTFSIRRFGKLIAKELTERIRIILIISISISLAYIAYVLWETLMDGNPIISMGARTSFIIFASLLTSVFAPFILYKDINHKRKGVDYITLPVSVNEKFLSMVLISLVVTPLAIFSTLLLADTLAVLIHRPPFGIFIFSKGSGSLSYILNQVSNYSALPFLTFAGNLHFRENKIVKTLLFCAAFWAIYIFVVSLVSALLVYEYNDQIQKIIESEGMQNNSSLMENPLATIENFPVLKLFVNIMTAIFTTGVPIGALIFSHFKMRKLQY